MLWGPQGDMAVQYSHSLNCFVSWGPLPCTTSFSTVQCTTQCSKHSHTEHHHCTIHFRNVFDTLNWSKYKCWNVFWKCVFSIVHLTCNCTTLTMMGWLPAAVICKKSCNKTLLCISGWYPVVSDNVMSWALLMDCGRQILVMIYVLLDMQCTQSQYY